MSSSLGAEFLGTEDVENDVTSNVEGFISKSMDDVALENGTPGSPCHMNSKSASSEASISHSIEDKLLESRVSLPLNFQEQELCHQPINDIHDPPVDTVLNSNSSTDYNEIQGLLDDYKDLFEDPKTLPPFRNHNHSIPLQPNTQPISVRPYRYPHFQKAEIEKLVSEMLANDYST
ncbi:hypothetical protein GH714_021767 [Hevea brasiliensis]|uniref:Uncharacterized protein n=1 Tax=Hevea brasiliensis TaxID=3981 RepID=A0A6A6LLW2_HEVBR|nr:hypothetical protein GH714_021767 [Hevea brasiliensis]